MNGLSYRKTYPLKGRWSVEFTLGGDSIHVEWSPRMPSGELGRMLLPRYREARNDFLKSLDIKTLVIEL
ncbi:hypothetical protein ABC955_10050 [Citromicrobium bathyomarinum]